MHAVTAGVLGRDDVAQLGDVLSGTVEGRKADRDITVFDSTGLAIQDLAIALAAMARARARSSDHRSLAPSTSTRERTRNDLLRLRLCGHSVVAPCPEDVF